MARKKSSMVMNASLEVETGGPLDSREVVDSLTDLTDAASFPYSYEGMQVYVKSEKKTYALVGDDPTVIENWQEIGTDYTAGQGIRIEGENINTTLLDSKHVPWGDWVEWDNSVTYRNESSTDFKSNYWQFNGSVLGELQSNFNFEDFLWEITYIDGTAELIELRNQTEYRHSSGEKFLRYDLFIANTGIPYENYFSTRSSYVIQDTCWYVEDYRGTGGVARVYCIGMYPSNITIQQHPAAIDMKPYHKRTVRELSHIADNDLEIEARINNRVEEYVDGKTISPTGWGIAKKGFVQISNNGGEFGEATVDVSELGFTNTDDYSVSLLVAGGAGGYGGVNTYIKNKTTTGFVIHWARVAGGSATRVDYEYTIIAKGYGNNSSGWGLATVAKTSINTSSGSTTQTIDISGFGFVSADDYTVSCNIYSGQGDWAKAIMNVGSKTATSFILIVKSVASDITRVDVEYAIIAKGYGGSCNSGGSGETPTLDAVLKKGNETDNTARFTGTDSSTEISNSGAYMTGIGTEGMRQFSISQDRISAVDNLVGTVMPKFVVPFEPSGEDQVAMSDAVKESFMTALGAQRELTAGNYVEILPDGTINVTNLPTIVGSDWGVAKTGTILSIGASLTVTVDISNLNLSSVEDYIVYANTIHNGSIYPASTIQVVSRSATQFGIYNNSSNNTYGASYVVLAKGYGSTPAGGTKGQALVKKSNADGDVEWGDVGSGGSGLPSGGAKGDIIVKKSSEDGDVEWTPLDVSEWGVVRTGVATVEFNNGKWSTSATIDVSEYGFSSGADYDVMAQPTTGGTATPWGSAIAFVNADKGASSFSVSSFTMEESLSGTVNVKYTIFAKGYGTTVGGSGGSINVDTAMSDTSENAVQNKVAKAYVDAADAELQKQKATGYFERTDYPITLETVGQPYYAIARDVFTIEIENHKPYTYEFTAIDVYDLTTRYNETTGKTFITTNEDNETIYITMKGALPDNVQYVVGSTNPVVDLTNATVTLTKTTFIQQIDDMLIPRTSGEVFVFDVDSDQFTEDPENTGGKHYGMTIDSPTFDEIMDNLVAGKIVFVRTTFNGGNSYNFYQLNRGSQQDINGHAFELEFPQGHIWYYDIYIRKRGLGTNATTYFGVFSDKVVDDSGSSGGTVDQTYDGTSTNAQSGIAVAEAVAAAVYDDTTLAGKVTDLESAVGDTSGLSTIATDLSAAVNELKNGIDALGEPFRVKQWGSNTLNVEIPYCTEDIANANIPKMVFSIDNVEGADYQIVGMIAYEVFDAASGGNRINCFPVCQFTGNGQKELSVRWACMGTTRKTAKRINAWVLLKHR